MIDPPSVSRLTSGSLRDAGLPGRSAIHFLLFITDGVQLPACTGEEHMEHIYYVVIVTPQSRQHYKLEFEFNPTIKEVLDTLAKQPHVKETFALTVNILKQVHASGQEQQLFNESTEFECAVGSSWLRIVCPQNVCPIFNVNNRYG